MNPLASLFARVLWNPPETHPQRLLRWVLLPPAWLVGGLYTGLTGLRLLLWCRGWLQAHRAPVPVISVGNLSVGGSGKTPMVETLLRLAQKQGLRPVCLSRGHGRQGLSSTIRVCQAQGSIVSASLLGDEPALLALRNPAVPLYVDRKRARAARLAMIWEAPSLMVLDDGYQHLGLERQLNLLLVDAKQGFGNGRTLPLGPLREPLREIRRANLIVISKANGKDVSPIREQIRRLGFSGPVFQSDYLPLGLRRLDDGEARQPDSLQGRRVGLACGLAQPQGFVDTVVALGAQLTQTRIFPDHHPFSAEDVAQLDRMAESLAEDGGAGLLVTEKDAVKLRGRLLAPQRVWVLEMGMLPEPSSETFLFEFMKDGKIPESPRS